MDKKKRQVVDEAVVVGAAEVTTFAIKWWCNIRPTTFSLAEHLGNPTINTCGESEYRLAKAVAKFILVTKKAYPGWRMP